MNWMVIALIVFVAMWAYERNRNLRLRHENTRLIEQITRLSGSPADSGLADDDQDTIDARELEELRNRVQVLERIATDDNSCEARKAQRIAREIESLRGDIARRSSKNMEDLSE
ncbi:hypothetical protein FGU71_09370 [Erythrobacter insulae]|uniref:Uncharacterized protein n=1 Tax=Erythrobacter insulae TaxID=2584124 RepID=A0A547PD18_9SPHN|nr:hypothetical protein [Erythrobacter insulae]TRD12046.1 hypothetical protein FGU71_09370 [Erythrobacter insulae]